MTFTESVKRNLGREYLFSFRGRASRSEYWWFMLFIGLVNMLVYFICENLPPKIGMNLSLIVSLLLVSPNIGVTVRRLHDRNLRGWWLLAPLTPLLFWVLSGGYSAPPDMLLSVLSLAVALCYLVILCLPGTPGPNRFGPAPEN